MCPPAGLNSRASPDRPIVGSLELLRGSRERHALGRYARSFSEDLNLHAEPRVVGDKRLSSAVEGDLERLALAGAHRETQRPDGDGALRELGSALGDEAGEPVVSQLLNDHQLDTHVRAVARASGTAQRHQDSAGPAGDRARHPDGVLATAESGDATGALTASGDRGVGARARAGSAARSAGCGGYRERCAACAGFARAVGGRDFARKAMALVTG